MVAERRRKRSNFAGLALQYWLSALARHQGLRGLVLADSAGLLVAASLRGPAAEELAALAPLLDGPARPPLTGAPLDDEPVLVRKLWVDRTLLYLCALGERSRGEDAFPLAARGVKRILASH